MAAQMQFQQFQQQQHMYQQQVLAIPLPEY
jgi:hypothetical protein